MATSFKRWKGVPRIITSLDFCRDNFYLFKVLKW